MLDGLARMVFGSTVGRILVGVVLAFVAWSYVSELIGDRAASDVQLEIERETSEQTLRNVETAREIDAATAARAEEDARQIAALQAELGRLQDEIESMDLAGTCMPDDAARGLRDLRDRLQGL